MSDSIIEKAQGFNKLGRVLRLKCPNCGKANVFYRAKFPVFSVPEMKKNCNHCNYKFDKEPGYFLGAMYVSYGLAVVEGLLAFLSAKHLIFGLSDITLAFVTVAAILLCVVWNYRISRVIWLNIFPVD